VIRQAAESGSLYGSVTARDVSDVATEGGFSIGRGQVVLDRPVKELGLHAVRVVLHPEVSANITVNVARSAEEAELQASGKSIQDVRAEEDSEAEFEIAELFDDMGGAAEAEGESTLIEDR
jgi:large subunit ribosomal protein L9